MPVLTHFKVQVVTEVSAFEMTVIFAILHTSLASSHPGESKLKLVSELSCMAPVVEFVLTVLHEHTYDRKQEPCRDAIKIPAVTKRTLRIIGLLFTKIPNKTTLPK